MNTLRTFSYVLAATTVMFVGSARSVGLSEEMANEIKMNRFTIAASVFEALAFKKDEHVIKAAIDTIVVALDFGPELDNAHRPEKKLDYLNALSLLYSFGANYFFRKGSELVGKKLISVDDVANKCDVWPEGYGRDAVNGLVKGTLEIVTHPPILMYLVVNYVVEPMMGGLGGGGKSS